MVKLERIEIYEVEIARKGVFRIATGSSSSVRNIVLRLEGRNCEGWGAGAPTIVTGETLESIKASLVLIKKELSGRVFETPEEAVIEAEALIGKNPSAMAAFDIAIFDLFSREYGMSLYKYLSEKYGTRPRERMLTDITLGIEGMEKTVEEALQYIDAGFRALKVKIGLDFDEDMKRIEAVRDAVGRDVKLWADANQGYSVDEALRASEILSDNGYLFFEQPVKWDDFDGLKEVSERAKIPIFADESAKNIEFAERIAKEHIAGGINIKLMKFGGIRRATKVREIAEKHGLDLMVGCMGETSLTVAAALHFAMAFPEISYADLDSQFMLKDDLAEGILFEDGFLSIEGNGLGVEAKQGALKTL